MKDPFVREKFTRERTAARKLAKEYFERYPRIASGPRSKAGAICNRGIMSFTMKRLREPIGPA
jgi:hypothetical protein